MTSEAPQTRLVPPEVGRVRFDLGKALWLWGLGLPGVLLAPGALTPGLLLAALLMAFATLCLGHSVGLHRGIIHRTYRMGPALRGVLSYLFVLTGLGGPISWARLHATRDYWQGRSDCPPYFRYRHSLARDFVWNLHLRFEAADDRTDAKLHPDVLSDPWLLFLERTWPLHNLLLALVLFAVAGADGVLVCACARTAGGILGHWAIGYVSHAHGECPHEIPGAAESGTNNWLLGVLSFGEGFHNNHHAYPWSARMGLKKHELDLGWLVLRGLRRLGLVHDLRSATTSSAEAQRGAEHAPRVMA